MACIVVLHFVRSDLAPVAHRLSEYANGPYDYLMLAAFVALGLGMLVLGLALLRGGEASVWRWIVPAVVGGAGVGMIVSGMYPTDPRGADTTAEAIHSRASAFSSVALIASAFVWSVLRRRGGARRRPDGPAVIAVLAVAIGCVSPALHESAWSGLSQRLLWATLLAWLILTACQLAEPRAVPAVRQRP